MPGHEAGFFVHQHAVAQARMIPGKPVAVLLGILLGPDAKGGHPFQPAGQQRHHVLHLEGLRHQFTPDPAVHQAALHAGRTVVDQGKFPAISHGQIQGTAQGIEGCKTEQVGRVHLQLDLQPAALAQNLPGKLVAGFNGRGLGLPAHGHEAGQCLPLFRRFERHGFGQIGAGAGAEQG